MGNQEKQTNKIHDDLAAYHTEKLSTFGNTPKGVDWNGEASQKIRFVQLCKLIDTDTQSFSINDVGCGYGALRDYLDENFVYPINYLGVDVCDSMISNSRERFPGRADTNFQLGHIPSRVADYTFGSGLFSLRMSYSEEEWQAHVISTLDILFNSCQRGMAFNNLTSYADSERMEQRLYYADPLKMFDMCKRRYSDRVALLHDYGLYDFTILVRK